MFVSALLSLILSTRNKLAHLGYSHASLHPIYISLSNSLYIFFQVLPKDPFLHPYAFSLALTAYVQACPPSLAIAVLQPQPYALTTSSNYIPPAPTPANLLSTAAAAAAAQNHPIGIILTRELVESINNTYDLKIRHESNKVRRAIKNRRTTADSDGGADEQRGRERISISGGEGPRDGSPVRSGVGSSGGQILSGIGSLASGLRLGTGAVGDAGSIVTPTVDLTNFIDSIMGHGSHKDNLRRVKERRRKESVDLVPINGTGKERDGVVGGGLKLLWSGRVADIVRMREMDVDFSSCAGTHERDRDRWKRRRLPGSDGELDEKGRKIFDGRSTEEESEPISIPGHTHSFSGMWGGRVRGKLGSWAGYVVRLFS